MKTKRYAEAAKKIQMRTAITLVVTLVVTLVLTLVSTLVACSGKDAKSHVFKPKLDVNSTDKIVIAGNYANFAALEAEIDRFNTYYPNVEIVYNFLDNYNAAIQTAIFGSESPDIYTTFQWMLDKEKYSPLFENAEDMSDEKKTGISLGSISKSLLYHQDDGKIPMIPVLCYSHGMMVNEDLFKKHGLEIPTTYSKLIEVCSKLKDAGYKSPILSHDSSLAMIPQLIQTHFCREMKKNPDGVASLNALDPSAGEYMRSSLEWIEKFRDTGFIDLDECKKLKNNYNDVILTFFEGDVPMVLVDATVVSGTKKRESLSEAFTARPFKYSFHPVPTTDDALFFVNASSVEFSVNKNSPNLDMANEFMRFLTRVPELNNLARTKGLITSSTDYSFDEVYSALKKAKPIYLNETGLTDNVFIQLRNAAFKVMHGEMSVDEAVKNFGNF